MVSHFCQASGLKPMPCDGLQRALNYSANDSSAKSIVGSAITASVDAELTDRGGAA